MKTKLLTFLFGLSIILIGNVEIISKQPLEKKKCKSTETKNFKQCKRDALRGSDYCRVHAPKCTYYDLDKDKTCESVAENGKNYCRIHRKK